VLDSEELSLVNTTFHCIPEQEKPSAHGQISQLIKPVVIPKFSSTTAISLEKTSETPTTSSPTNLIVSLIGSGLKRSEDHPSNGHGKNRVIMPNTTVFFHNNYTTSLLVLTLNRTIRN
jgi:hypothetical protein